jgi:hypothetical protein
VAAVFFGLKLAGLAMLAVFRLRLGLPKTLAASAALGALWRLVVFPS